MTFDEWFNGREAHSLRSERFYDDLYAYKFDGVNPEYIVRWLQAAYNEGYNHRKYELMDDGK